MLDNAALCKEEITQELLKYAHSERIRHYKMKFISMEEKKKHRTEIRFTHISLILFFGMLMPNTHAVFWCSCCYYTELKLASYTWNVMVSTWRDKDKGIILALLLSYLRCLFCVFCCICYLSLRYGSSPDIHSIHVFWCCYHSLYVSEEVTACKVNSSSESSHAQAENKSQDTSKSDPVTREGC